MKCKKILISLLTTVCLFGVIGCEKKQKEASVDNEKEITVFAAASLTESFTEIGKNFEKEKKIKVKFNFAGSQALASSIKEGAAVDVFASANKKYMEELLKANMISESNIFVNNTLIICKNKKSGKTINELKNLAADGVKIIVGDKSVPCGSYFYNALDSAVKDGKLSSSEKEKILKNIKSEELNVKDIVTKVQLGDGDVGIVYKSDITEANKKDLDMIKVNEFSKLNVEYPIGVVKNSKSTDEAKAFVNYVNGKEGKTILEKYGFEAVK